MMTFARIFRFRILLCVLPLLLSAAPYGHAGDVEFTAEADRQQISQDESVSLKLSVQQDGNAGGVSDPQIHAPDFDQLTSYQSQSIQSYYDNGHFGMKTTIQVTVVLRPKHTGALKISDISVKVGANDYKAGDITIQVTPSGAGTAPPRGYGGNFGLQGSGKRSERRPFFLRAEVSKDKVFKGEQIIVSYYLYRRVRVFNVQPSQYPVLNGFLREDLDIPVISQRFTNEPVVLDGVAYDRTLLARYAAYPLQEGKLKLDSMTVQANYYGENSMPGMEEDEDPFQQFFKRLAPKSDTQKSEQVVIDVSPLPDLGKPSSFTGVVGEFDVKAAVDKTEVKAGEPVTLTVIVEGRGNLASLKEPKSPWPDGVDLYESKAHSKSSSGGIGQKIFEFLLIPRNAGELILPSLEFAFFNPTQRVYEAKKTDAIRIQVLPGSGGNAVGLATPAPGAVSGDVPKPLSPKLPGLLQSGAATAGPSIRMISWLLFGFAALAAAAMAAYFGFRVRRERKNLRKKMRVSDLASRWEALSSDVRAISPSSDWHSVFQAYENLEALILEEIAGAYGLPAKSLSRLDIERQVAGDIRWNPAWWIRCRGVLEFSEAARFSGSDRAFQVRAAEVIVAKVQEGRALAAEIRRARS